MTGIGWFDDDVGSLPTVHLTLPVARFRQVLFKIGEKEGEKGDVYKKGVKFVYVF